jgi:hypothetical protein
MIWNCRVRYTGTKTVTLDLGSEIYFDKLFHFNEFLIGKAAEACSNRLELGKYSYFSISCKTK